MTTQRFFGKHRGVVVDNQDPKKLGRVQVRCPTVLGDATPWAMPCVPYAGPKVGVVSMPPVDAQVWVEFEAGELARPIWSGCFWGADELPAEWSGPEQHLVRTEGVTLMLDDTQGSGGFKLTVATPAANVEMTLNAAGDTLELVLGSAKVTLSMMGVNINDGALELM